MGKLNRTRIADIVARTGLSRATIDRVINDRGGVSLATRKRIDIALGELGFAPSRLDTLLHSGPTKVEAFVVEGSNPFFHELAKGLQFADDRNDGKCDITFHGFAPYTPENLAEKLKNVQPDTKAVILVGIDSPVVVRAINALESRGVRVIVIISDVAMSRRSTYVGLDNFAAGRTAGRLMVEMSGQTPGTFATVVSQMQFRHLMDRRAGFEQFISMREEDHQIIFAEPHGTEPGNAQRTINNLIEAHPDITGFYLCGGVFPEIFETFASKDVKVIAHEVTDHTRDALANGTANYIIALNVYEMGHKALHATWCNLADCPTTDPCGINIYVPENLPQP